MRTSLALSLLLAACSGPSMIGDDAGSTPTDPCMPNPCSEAHRGVCEAPHGIAECRCDAGYEELAGVCTAITTCGADTCGGHGTCSIGTSGPMCACTLGWTGRFCEACDEANGYY